MYKMRIVIAIMHKYDNDIEFLHKNTKLNGSHDHF